MKEWLPWLIDVILVIGFSLYIFQSNRKREQLLRPKKEEPIVGTVLPRRPPSPEDHPETLIDSLPLGIIITDPIGYITRLNLKAADLLGYSHSDLSNKHLSVVFHEHREQRKEAFIQMLKDKTAGRLLELNALRKDGTEIPLDVAAGDHDDALVISIVDVRERKHLEQMKAEIIAVVTHDLRSPLTSIGANMELLAMNAGGELNERGQQITTGTRREVKRLMRLIQDILEIEKMSSGRFELQYGEFPLVALMEAASEAIDGWAERRNIRIDCDGPDIELHVDGERLVQVLVNLLSNAVKFSPEGGVVRLLGERHPESVEISVIDQGPGIPEEHQEAVFEKFRQLRNQGNAKGSGLGLAICKAIVEEHGGKIGCTSTLGAGSTFWIRLPYF